MSSRTACCPFVFAPFSIARRLSSLGSFRFCIALSEDMPRFDWRVPAERLMRPAGEFNQWAFIDADLFDVLLGGGSRANPTALRVG